MPGVAYGGGSQAPESTLAALFCKGSVHEACPQTGTQADLWALPQKYEVRCKGRCSLTVRTLALCAVALILTHLTLALPQASAVTGT